MLEKHYLALDLVADGKIWQFVEYLHSNEFAQVAQIQAMLYLEMDDIKFMMFSNWKLLELWL